MTILVRMDKTARWWQSTPLILALGTQSQVNLCFEFKASSVYRTSSGTPRATQRNFDKKKKHLMRHFFKDDIQMTYKKMFNITHHYEILKDNN